MSKTTGGASKPMSAWRQTWGLKAYRAGRAGAGHDDPPAVRGEATRPMIGSTSSGSSFAALAVYLKRGRGDVDPEERIVWTATRNLFAQDLEEVAFEMDVTAEQNLRGIEKPVYHVSISAAPGEELTREQWEQVADRVLESLGLAEHQALIAAHGDRDHAHIHIMANRVHPDTLKVWKTYRDWPKIERALRELEREMGLREVPGHHYQLDGQEPPDRAVSITSGERQEQIRTGDEPWALRMRFRLFRDFRDATSWADLERRLAANGVRLQARGRGLVVTDGERQVKASRIHRTASRYALEERFDLPFQDWRKQVDEVQRAVEDYTRAERWREELSRTRMHVGATTGELEDFTRPLEDLRIEVLRLEERLEIQLASVYTPEALPEAARALERTVSARGHKEAAEELRREPGKFGRLEGLAPLTPERRRALAEAEGAAGLLRELGGARHRLHRKAERLAAEPPLGPTSRAVRKALDDLRGRLLPDLEELYGPEAGRGVLRQLRSMTPAEALSAIESPPESFPLPRPEAHPDARSRLLHRIEQAGDLRRELAEALEREKRLAWQADRDAGREAPDPKPATAARWRLDSAYEGLEGRLGAVSPDEEIYRLLHRMPPRHALPHLADTLRGNGTAVPEAVPAALETARADLEEIAHRRREVFQQLGRERRKAWEADRDAGKDGTPPTPLTQARWRLDAAWERLEDELAPLWTKSDREEALRQLHRQRPWGLAERMAADPSLAGEPSDQLAAQRIVEEARTAFQKVAERHREVLVLLDREERHTWEKERGAGDLVAQPDPVTEARWRLDRGWEQVEEKVRPLWKEAHQEDALSRLRGLDPGEGRELVAHHPERPGLLEEKSAKAPAAAPDLGADFERLAQLRREMFQALDRHERLQWERDRRASRPVPQPDPVTAARWRLDRSWQEIEEKVRPLWTQESQEEALRQLRSQPPRRAHEALQQEPGRFGELAVPAKEARATIEHHEPDFYELAQHHRELLRMLDRRARVAWKSDRAAGEKVAEPEPVTAARWRLDRGWQQVEEKLRPLWSAEHQEEALRRLRAISPRVAQETLRDEPRHLGPLAVPAKEASATAERHRGDFEEIGHLRRELLQVLDRQNRLGWEADRKAGRQVPDPDPVTAARWHLDRAAEHLEGQLARIYTPETREQATRALRRLRPTEAAQILDNAPSQAGRLALPRREHRQAVEQTVGTLGEMAQRHREVPQAQTRQDRHQWERDRVERKTVENPDRVTAARWRLDHAWEHLETQLRRAVAPAEQDAAVRALRRLSPEAARRTLERFPHEIAPSLNHQAVRAHLPQAESTLNEIGHLHRQLRHALDREQCQAWEASQKTARPLPEPDPVTAIRWQLDTLRERLESHLVAAYGREQAPKALEALDRLHPRDAGRALATQPERFGQLPGKASWRIVSPERREAMTHVRQAALTLGEIDTGRVRLTQALRLAHDHQRRGLELTSRGLKLRLTTLPARLTLERQVASLVYKAGFKALSLVLPKYGDEGHHPVAPGRGGDGTGGRAGALLIIAQIMSYLRRSSNPSLVRRYAPPGGRPRAASVAAFVGIGSRPETGDSTDPAGLTECSARWDARRDYRPSSQGHLGTARASLDVPCGEPPRPVRQLPAGNDRIF